MNFTGCAINKFNQGNRPFQSALRIGQKVLQPEQKIVVPAKKIVDTTKQQYDTDFSREGPVVDDIVFSVKFAVNILSIMKNPILTIATIASAATFSACCGNSENIEGVKSLDMDDFEVTWIRDNAEPRFMERTLFSDASDSLITALGLEDGVPASMSAFLVRKDGKLLLFDTGLGAENSMLPGAMESMGVQPDDIDFLFLTHLHGDHIGGMLKDGAAVFPNAEVYVSKAEYDGWMAMPEGQNANAVRTMDAYKERLHLFYEADSLPCGVKPIAAYGHTPGHTVYRIGKLLIVGDIMHGAAVQLPHPEICANFDMDKPAATASRIMILDYARENGLTQAGMHFPEPAFMAPDLLKDFGEIR